MGIDRDVPTEIIVATRAQCAAGDDVKATARARQLGVEHAPDSSDRCPSALARLAREGTLLGLYQDLVADGGGQVDGYRTLPSAIGAAAMKPTQQVSIGNGRAAVITAALAWDAGFTVAFQKQERLSPAMPGLATLKPVAERCLDLAEPDLSLCFSTGYVYGARAASGAPLRLE